METAEYEVMFRVEETHWWYRALHRLIFSTLDREQPGWRNQKILDAGCGTGALLLRLDQTNGTIGVDISPQALAFCRQRGLTNVEQGDICALACADESFDAVICSSVLYHTWVTHVPAALQEFHRVLRPGGLLIINLPAYRFLHSAHDEVVMTARRFTRPEVQSALRNAGFKIRRLTYWTTLLFPLAVIARTFHGSKRGRDFEAGAVSNRILGGIMGLEEFLLRGISMPFGVALLALARKPGALA